MSTKIEWTDETWNPVRGCSIVSPGCTNCYAMRQAHRQSAPGKAYHGLTKMSKGGPVWTGKVRVVDELLGAPLHWKRPRPACGRPYLPPRRVAPEPLELDPPAETGSSADLLRSAA